MKRNNLFMMAYIIFIFICAIVRLFGEFSHWQVIVAAITATSWIFALADFNHTAGSELNAISKVTLECAESSIENIQEMLTTINAFLNKNQTKAENELVRTKQEQVNHYVRTKEQVIKCLGNYEEMEFTAKKYSRVANISSRLAGTLTVVGFIGFFSILCFEGFSKIIISSQDIMTVMSFGIILLTQYMGDLSKEKRQKYKETTKNMDKGWKALKKSFELEVSKYAD